MAFFLNERRRLQLIADLRQLTMPDILAVSWANISEDEIDARLAAIIEDHQTRFHDLGTAERRELDADALILSAYMAELRERGLKLQ